jgi:proteasome lid subunit RPN8/RPN11
MVDLLQFFEPYFPSYSLSMVDLFMNPMNPQRLKMQSKVVLVPSHPSQRCLLHAKDLDLLKLSPLDWVLLSNGLKEVDFMFLSQPW